MMLGRVITHLGVGPPIGDPFGTPSKVFRERQAIDVCVDRVAEGDLPGVVVVGLPRFDHIADERKVVWSTAGGCSVGGLQVIREVEVGLRDRRVDSPGQVGLLRCLGLQA